MTTSSIRLETQEKRYASMLFNDRLCFHHLSVRDWVAKPTPSPKFSIALHNIKVIMIGCFWNLLYAIRRQLSIIQHLQLIYYIYTGELFQFHPVRYAVKVAANLFQLTGRLLITYISGGALSAGLTVKFFITHSYQIRISASSEWTITWQGSAQIQFTNTVVQEK